MRAPQLTSRVHRIYSSKLARSKGQFCSPHQGTAACYEIIIRGPLITIIGKLVVEPMTSYDLFEVTPASAQRNSKSRANSGAVIMRGSLRSA